VHRVTRRDGSSGWILFRARITPNDAGDSNRLLGAVIDISDIRQAIDNASAETVN
jgi:PAS domain-containing protein